MGKERPEISEHTKKKKRKPARGLRSSEAPSLRPTTKSKGKQETKKNKMFKRRNSDLAPAGKDGTLHTEKKNPSVNNPPGESEKGNVLLSSLSPPIQRLFFLSHFQSANKIKLSPLELEAFQDTCFVELSQTMEQDVGSFSKHMAAIFGKSANEVLCNGKLSGEKAVSGSPAVLIITTSALRTLELLRGLKEFTRECHPVKLFAKHMKVEEQVSMLKRRVNIASGTPNRIKKLIDMDALIFARLAVIVLDMQLDSKGFSLFTLKQISSEFWNLYNTHLLGRILEGSTRICFYGALPQSNVDKAIAKI